MKLAIGSDHAGFELKEYIKDNISLYISKNYTGNFVNLEIKDLGTYNLDSVDYPDFAVKVANSVASGENELGILVCGSGVGVSITANKVRGIRAANVFNPEMAKLAREHNNANIMTLGSRFIDQDTAMEMIMNFLLEPFAGGRHATRVDKIHTLTGC